ncbi:hypothetical protein F5Y16DRAFT_399198 [Xylariaceae sp. FL0255]|nr:hypothetical protein F5Y16DRAFT_399198 [Xylariaceae sp. FL0255]
MAKNSTSISSSHQYKKEHKHKHTKTTKNSHEHSASSSTTTQGTGTGTDTGSSGYQLNAYMSSLNGGGDPVTALGVRGTPSDVSVSHRHADVQRSVRDSLSQYYQTEGNGSST